ncbi:MAG: trypsin-like peptidase domain-containing protein [Deltaproteobacteria bacterium]|nr:trypsin-like peptidase domain-containing protein [Deltaproteobacteria bacterium]MBW2362755.1 trypsin-like peptidase domain-containing protein [Deltaproteobacteria bacterium]
MAEAHNRRRFAPHATCALVAAIVGSAWLAPGSAAATHPTERAIVRIQNHAQRGDWYAPWSASAPRQSVGSGFVVEGGLVMTNAHVVSDTRMLLIHVNGDPRPHEARVRWVGHDCDLALIEPLEPDLLDGVTPLRFGGMPKLGSSVETYGYPSGGQRISSTRGIVSRIEMNLFSHSGLDYHLTVQTDAAINPGNSGGPVLQGGRVVGVAFQAATALENVGFFIPTEVVRHFLEDVEDGHHAGYPALGVTTSNLENPAARRRAGLAADESGVRVDFVFPDGASEGLLQPGDVILELDGHDIANDGTIREGDIRLHFGVLLDRHQVGDVAHTRVLRAGEHLDVRVRMTTYPPLARYANTFDTLPRYYVYAGLVFVPFDREIMKTNGKNWMSKADKHLLYEFFHRFMDEPESMQREPVLLLRRLDHPANANMAWHRNLIVDKVNGQTIDRLEDVIEAIETNQQTHHEFEFEYFGRFGVLERDAAERGHAEVLERYAVPEDRRL